MKTKKFLIFSAVIFLSVSQISYADIFGTLKGAITDKAKEIVNESEREVDDAPGAEPEPAAESGTSRNYDCDFPTRDGCPASVEDLEQQTADVEGQHCYYGQVLQNNRGFASGTAARKVCLSDDEPILFPTSNYFLKDDLTLATFPHEEFSECSLARLDLYKEKVFFLATIRCNDDNATEISFERQVDKPGIFITNINYSTCAPHPNFKGSKFDQAIRAKYGEATEEDLNEQYDPATIDGYHWCASGDCDGWADTIEYRGIRTDGRGDCANPNYYEYLLTLEQGEENYQKWADYIQEITINRMQDSYTPDL